MLSLLAQPRPLALLLATSTKPSPFFRLLPHRPVLQPQSSAPRLSTTCLRLHCGLSEPSSRSPLSHQPGSPQDPKSLNKGLISD